jgi:putative FmdB family regulatory protein
MIVKLPDMPIYNYSCQSCGTSFEELVRSDTRVRCPSCEGAKVERRLSIPAPPVTARAASSAPVCESPPPGGCCGGVCGPLH